MQFLRNLNGKRVISGVLASIMLSQAFIYGDGTCKGLLHNDTIKAMAETQDEQSNYSNYTSSYEEVSDIAVSGYIGLEDGRNREITVLVFDDSWNTIASTTVSSNEYFSISANNISGSTSTTHIKIECNGYLPRFYKDMGFGSYQLGTQDNPEVLLFGDTTYNEGADNQWSDEVINNNDLDFIYEQKGKIKGDENYDEYYDFNQDNRIDNEDVKIIAQYDGAIYENDVLYTSSTKESYYINPLEVLKYDLNHDNVINSEDQQVLCDLYPYTTFKGDEDFDKFAYMDINENNEIDENDCEYFKTYINNHNGCNPYNDYIYNLTLTGDSYHNGAMYLENTNLDLDNYKLTVNGNFVFRTANPYQSMWNGNPEVTLNINGGTLFIADQFDFGQANSYDKIIMTNENGRLYVNGIWNYVTLADMEGLWTAGTIYFFGPTWQVNEASGDKSIYSTGTHSICFYYASGQQVIRWANTQDCIYNEQTGEYNTLRRFNFDYVDDNGNCLGVTFPCGYSDDRYYFRASLPEELTFSDKITIPYEDWSLLPSIDGIIPDIIRQQIIVNPEAIDNDWLSNFYGEQTISAFNSYKPELVNLLTESIDGNASNFYQIAEVFEDAIEYGYPEFIELVKDKAGEFIIKVAGEELVGQLVTIDGVSEWLVTLGIGNIVKDISQIVPFIAEAKGIIEASSLTAGFMLVTNNSIDALDDIADKIIDKTTGELKDIVVEKLQEEFEKSFVNKYFENISEDLLKIKSLVDEDGNIRIDINFIDDYEIYISNIENDFSNWRWNYKHIQKTVEDVQNLQPVFKAINDNPLVETVKEINTDNYENIVVGTINKAIDCTEPLADGKIKEILDETIGEFFNDNYLYFYSVQNKNDSERLVNKIEDWPQDNIGDRANLGDGVYAWSTLEEANNYLIIKNKRTTEKLYILEVSISKSDFEKLNKLDMTTWNDDQKNEWFDEYAKLYGGTPTYEYDYIKNMTNLGTENYFSKYVFSKLNITYYQ